MTIESSEASSLPVPVAIIASTASVAFAALMLLCGRSDIIPTDLWTGGGDKVGHVVAYAALAALLLPALSALSIRWRTLAILAGAATLGAIDEWTQPFFGRQCCLSDWVANIIGVLLPLTVFLAWRLAIRLRPRPTG